MAFQTMPTPPPGASALGSTAAAPPGAPPPPQSPATGVQAGPATDGYTVAASVGAPPMSGMDVVMAAAGAMHTATAANLVHTAPQTFIPVSQYPAGKCVIISFIHPYINESIRF